MPRFLILFLAIFSLLWLSCGDATDQQDYQVVADKGSAESEKARILEVLNAETAAAFSRDYDAWNSKWVHEPYVSKTYIDFADSSMSETLGWNDIDAFVKDFFKEHPTAEPVPKLLDSINVRLYGDAAWVEYRQYDSIRGPKRETRLMEKDSGQWKIAGMYTTIYASDHPEN